MFNAWYKCCSLVYRQLRVLSFFLETLNVIANVALDGCVYYYAHSDQVLSSKDF